MERKKKNISLFLNWKRESLSLFSTTCWKEKEKSERKKMCFRSPVGRLVGLSICLSVGRRRLLLLVKRKDPLLNIHPVWGFLFSPGLNRTAGICWPAKPKEWLGKAAGKSPPDGYPKVQHTTPRQPIDYYTTVLSCTVLYFTILEWNGLASFHFSRLSLFFPPCSIPSISPPNPMYIFFSLSQSFAFRVLFWVFFTWLFQDEKDFARKHLQGRRGNEIEFSLTLGKGQSNYVDWAKE